jgi:hypothetical protein
MVYVYAHDADRAGRTVGRTVWWARRGAAAEAAAAAAATAAAAAAAGEGVFQQRGGVLGRGADVTRVRNGGCWRLASEHKSAYGRAGVSTGVSRGQGSGILPASTPAACWHSSHSRLLYSHGGGVRCYKSHPPNPPSKGTHLPTAYGKVGPSSPSCPSLWSLPSFKSFPPPPPSPRLLLV